MPTGYIRSGLIAAFAIMFGILQLTCACLSIVPHTNQAIAPSHSTHQMNDMSAHKSSHDHDGPDHQAVCSHCDEKVVLALNVDVAPKVFTTPTFYRDVYSTPSFVPGPQMAATNLAGLRWLNPPRPLSSLSPVKLNTRSLT